MIKSLLIISFVLTFFVNPAVPPANNTPEATKKQKKGVTIIYLVRHVEKVTTDPQAQDPDLTPAGAKRAADLKVFLQKEPVDAFFSTKYKRNQMTLAPIAQGQTVQVYDAHDFTGLKNRILQEFRGKTILVVGHSNTILPIIETFGGIKPLAEIMDNQYDNLFRLKVFSNGKVQVDLMKFGERSS